MAEKVLRWTLFVATMVCVHSHDPKSKYKCYSKETISYDLFCDGHLDCIDGSDEITNAVLADALTEWKSCNNARNDHEESCLVHRHMICNEEVICSNLTPCDLKCDSHYLCQNSEKCVSRTTICNQNRCDGCPEDHEWTNGVGFKCKRNGKQCVLPQQLTHDDVPDCDGGADLCFGHKSRLDKTSRSSFQIRENLLTDNCFMCLNNITVIPAWDVCNGVIDCPDLSDECLCDRKRPEICRDVITLQSFNLIVDDVEAGDKPNKGYDFVRKKPTVNNHTICAVGEVRCKSGKCISRESICDGKRDCLDDEIFYFCRGTIPCRDAKRYEKSCRCHPQFDSCTNFYGSACDNTADCPVVADDGKILYGINTFSEDECDASCSNEPKYNFTCFMPSRMRVPSAVGFYLCETGQIRNGPFGNTTLNFDFNPIDGAKYCDGKIDCKLKGDDERDCPERFRCDSKSEGFVSIKRVQTCDGIEDCKDGSDESTSLCNKTRFYCPTLGGMKVNIDKNLVCDYDITCDDASDEKNCDDGRFYCKNEKPLFVRERQKYDGYGDCSDSSDEFSNFGPTTSKTSSRHDLVANPVLRTLVWIMGLFAICGNATVLCREGKKLQSKTIPPSVALANRLLILSLAASDILMGVYLISLGIAGFAMRGIYCSQDFLWRSSDACVALGVLNMLSSETSVMTMVMLTSCRMYAVFKPFKCTYQPRLRYVVLMILFSWTIGLFLALVPLSRYYYGTFVTHTQLEYAPYSRNVFIALDNARKLFDGLLTYDLRSNITIPTSFDAQSLSWIEMENLAKEMFNHSRFNIVKGLGYYSADSVCIPKFFATKSDRAWRFSLFLSIFNFVCFLFVASAYTAIYLRSREDAKVRKSNCHEYNKMKSMQRKILRLIITDFCCWIPICIMAFSKIAGADVSNTAYVVSAIVLLPINSALNPLLYSDLPDAMLHQMKRISSSRFCKSIKSMVPVKGRHDTVKQIYKLNKLSSETSNIEKMQQGCILDCK